MEINMTFEQVKGIYEEISQKYEAELSRRGVKCESEIYCEDEKLDKTENPEKARYFSLDINVFTEKIDKDNGLCFCASVPTKNMRVDDDDILDEQKAFEESINEFLSKLSENADADELIRAEAEATEQKVEEMVKELEHKIKKTNTIALIAVGVCVVAAAVALIMHFLV